MIKNWFKFFGLSFFSDNYAREAPKFGFTAVFVSLLLAFLFFLFGFMAADILPFATHYDNAGQYKEFIENAFNENGLSLSIENGKTKSDKVINTYTDKESAERYAKNGYNLIFDARSSLTLVEFTQAAVKGETEISYEDYLGLADKEGYKIVTRYTDKELEITQEKVAVYSAYFEKISKEGEESYNAEAAAEYKKHTENNGSDTELYYLFVKYYYTNASSVLVGAKAPVLRDYYYRNFIINDNAYYFYVFDDMLAGSFKTDGNVPVVFGGYFDKSADGEVKDIHEYVKSLYYATSAISGLTYFINVMSQLPMLIIIPIALGLIVWGIGKAVKNGWEKTFAGCFKIVNSFVWVSALITALVTFICGFLVTARTMYALMPVIFGAVLLIRAGIYCVLSVLKNRKELGGTEQKNKEDIFGGEL